MLDIFHIPTQQNNISIFYTQGGTGIWQTWVKPRNCKHVYITVIGAGSGGWGGGITSVSGSGGGSGAVSNGLFDASMLPDKLYISVGTGSAGGLGSSTATNNTSSAAGTSYVSVSPFVGGSVCLLTAYGAGTAGATNTAGAAITNGGSVNTRIQANSILTSLGTFSSKTGQNGSSTADTTILGTNITCAGGRGSISTTTAGSSIASLDLTTIVTPTITGGAGTTGGKGVDGVWIWKPIMFGTGGAGGGGATSGTAGAGGNGAYGCGGGGGGQAAAGGTGGNGGKGGDGLVIIATF
jgi:hypothetical protein